MLVFPQWRPELSGDGCRLQRWISTERFAPYLARPVPLPPVSLQIEDDESSGSLSPERPNDLGTENECVCEWRGCGARFESVARLSAHVARIHAHPNTDGFFYCCWKGCIRSQRGFNARYKMIVHMRIHTNERPHTCNQCQKSFSRAENLKIHLRSHSGEKPYVCPYEGCGKAYSNSSDRFKHTRTHKVDKPYCCKAPGCNKRYTDPSSLRKHVKAYKHFTNDKENPNQEPNNSIDKSLSPMRDTIYVPEPTSPHHHRIISPQRIISPTYSYSQVPETFTPINYMTMMDPAAYIRPVEPVYTRVPPQEMSFTEYSSMYDHAYRNYYSSRNEYPILRPIGNENVFSYNETRLDQSMEEVNYVKSSDKLEYDYECTPLNLMCSKRSECKPIDELVRPELPLDLSTKS
ncbi:zinc finger protein ZIC 1-like [Zerene cesonia]|uniref:zinc finger protein ZIC 1-like n=1 Tax=Zerene cesonia TaxID=33412 RepID=UPI0018E52AB1|nr:zinc finger protein ZIC 1-like [Zerene cesonia]